jgi:hypothetical protein
LGLLIVIAAADRILELAHRPAERLSHLRKPLRAEEEKEQ